MTKILGKIINAEFGTIIDYPFLMGLHLCFHLSDGCGVSDGGKYTVNISDACDWKTTTREAALSKIMLEVRDVLNDAKVNKVSELVNKPVEVTIDIENDTFVDFRILTEVL